MKVKVVYIGLIRSLVGKRDEAIEILPNATVKDALEYLSHEHGRKFTDILLSSEGTPISEAVMILVNGQQIEYMDGLNTKLGDDSNLELVVVRPIAGG